jgi:TRAP transporter TAXI family solute receptor
MRIMRVLTAVFVLALVAFTALPATAQTKVSLVFTSGPTGGSWIPLAGATAEVIKKRFPDLDIQVEPGAALVNMEKIRTDRAQLGWSMTNVLADARAGKGQWKGKQTDKPLYVASYYPNVWQLVVPVDSDIRSVKDLRGKPVALPTKGNTSLDDGWVPLLAAYGMKLDDLGPKSYGPVAENAELMKNRQAVANGWFTTVPASFIRDVGAAMKLRMLAYPDEIIQKMMAFNSGFVRHVIPAGTYTAQGITDDVITFQSPTILIAHSSVPADVIYKVTKAVVEERAHFANVTAAMKGITAKEMAQDYGMPFHPGAAKYYKEVGLLK